MNENTLAEIVRKCYLKYLNREPDDFGFKHYVSLMKTNQIDEESLIAQFKDSSEYKLSHPVEIEPNTPIDIKMKKEWNARAKFDTMFVIATGPSRNYSFWQSGMDDTKSILGLEGSRFKNIINKKDSKKMRILEIGCGIGRILIPVSKFFGESIGIDVSSVMVKQGQEHIANLSNCKILECNGIDLSLFPDNHFDFCYSYIVFQHIPEKKIVEKYVEEVSRTLKPDCLFRFQVRGIISIKPREITTWDGVQFSSKEMHDLAEKFNFDIIEEGNDKEEYYWLTFKLKK